MNLPLTATAPPPARHQARGFLPFELERDLSRYEYAVAYNLSESGVHPMRVDELYADAPEKLEALNRLLLGYAPGLGLPELREGIASTYEGATAENVIACVGAIEANFAAMTTVTRPGDEVVLMRPNYQQLYGVATNHGLQTKEFALLPEQGFAPDLDQLRDAVTPQTKLIAVCHPNNPCGRALTGAEMDAVIEIADRVGAWILADEVYRGSERQGEAFTPSFFGRYDKVMAVGSTSKAYGLPGLRLGWVTTDPETVDQVWARREYLSLCTALVANHMAAHALNRPTRDRVVARTRKLIRDGYNLLADWIDQQNGAVELTAHDASAITLLKVNLPDFDSRQYVDELREQHSVLLAPGDHLGVPGHVRISFGLDLDYLNAGLDRITAYHATRS
ncbi:MAG: aminotransferase class I/II-fold pyridoxal phosphate-dependent enzyme [Planctomycetota bacterium]